MKQRTLKFRAWDAKKKIFHPDFVGFHIIGEVTAFGLLNQYCLEDYNSLIITQFTGLVDKNGKDIYEGDLVTQDMSHEASVLREIFQSENAAKYTRGEVHWMNEGFSVCNKECGVTPLSEFVTCNCHPCALEVVGNVFENPL